MIKLTITGPYTAKDQHKADVATKFIGSGSAASSTAKYARDFGELANNGSYTKDDVVFISAEGNRLGRHLPDFNEINLAITASARFVTDMGTHRNRNYNVGEREVATYLRQNGYVSFEGNGLFALWRKK